MLKPIKNLLTYLQKNANSSSIFGLTNNMGPIEEPALQKNDIMNSSSEEANCEDPLYDPLALDDCDNELNVSNVSASTVGTASSELDSSSGQITLVDVTSLKSPVSSFTNRGSDDEGNGADDAEPVNISVNGHDDSGMSLENGHNDETKSTSLEDDSFMTASCGDTPNCSMIVPCVVAPGDSFESVPPVDETDASAASVPIAVVATQGAEEEEASDGSDSGLGSEPSRNLTTVEKGITELPPMKSNLKRRSAEEVTGASNEKRPKKGISFEGVTVFYFTRMQGFGCVPSQGGCTLGMEFQHVHSKRFTLAEHASEQRKMHRAQLQELNPRSSSSEETDSEEEPSESGSEAESESYGFLQPVTTRQRRALLKAAGVRKIDSSEKDECRVIRTSREVCGCTCRGYCDPDTCACSQAGIKCQVDRPNFPCGCTQDGCANVVGRVEFNPARVRTHFIHTIMRLNLDNKTNSEEHNGMAIHASSSYGSGKDWSSGPVRLPGLYGMIGVNGTDAVDGYHHLHHQHQHQYGASYLPTHAVPTAVPPGGESLDLHYAFRDYYGATQQTNDQLSLTNNSLMTSYYGNYPTNTDQYHQAHSGLIIDPRQSDPHSPYHGQLESAPSSSAVIMDDDVTLNTPINPNFSCDDHPTPADTTPSSTSQPNLETQPVEQPSSEAPTIDDEPAPVPSLDNVNQTIEEPNEIAATASPPSGDFIDLNTPLTPNSDRLEAINDLLESSRHAVNVAKQSVVAEDDELNDFRDPPVGPLSSVITDEQPCSVVDDVQDTHLSATKPNPQQSENSAETVSDPVRSEPATVVIETSENLSEIIKNSIVGTVSN